MRTTIWPSTTRTSSRASTSTRRVASLLVEHLTPAGRLEARALDELRGWDGRVGADSSAAAIYEVFRNELLRARHGDAVGDLLPAIMGAGPHPLLGATNSHFFLQTLRVVRFLETSPSDPLVRQAFHATVVWLSRRLGPSVADWQWGRLHGLHLQHALSTRKPLGMLFNVPSFPWGGDLETVRAGGSLPARY